MQNTFIYHFFTRNTLILFILLITLEANSQRPGGMGGEMQNMSPEGILKGQILDRRLNQPMEYANFVLYKAMDSTIVTGTVTEADGSFKLEKLPFGRYYAIANFIGYNKTTFADIRITPKAKEVDLGKIFLDQATTSIEGVEIVADKAPVEFKIDKKIVNVSQDLIGSTGTAVTVLENIPSVQVDIEGNVTLRGSGSFTVLVDGKPSVLQGSDALEQIPASTIDHIEIITNPSAKYDPDGVGGIINVVLKKQKQSGLNGVINASVSTGNKYATDFTLNYRTKSINIFGGADMNYREFTMEGLSEYTYLFDTISHKDSKMEGRMKRAGYAARAGFDYYLTHNSTLTLSGKYGFSEFGRKSESKIFEYYDYNLKPDVRTWSETQSERGGNYYELNMSFQHNFDSKGHKFEAFAYFSNSNSDDSEEQNEYYTDGNWIISDSTSSNVKTSEDETEKDIRIKADYTKPIGSHGKLEAGFQSRLQNENEDFLQQDLDQITGEWINNDEFSSEITFKDNIHSVYGIFSNTWKTFGYQIGLRGEYTDREIAHAGSDKSWVIDQLDYFPSIHLSKEFQKGHQVLASYSRRIERPDGRELDPTPNYMNSDNIRIGNPALKPEYIDSYELSYQKRLNKSFLSVEGYYRINKNKITQLRTVDSSQINIHTVDNLNRDFSLGIEAMVNADFTKWLSFSGSVNLYDYRLEGTLESGEVKSNSTNWDGRGNLTLKFKPDIRIQITEMYHGPSVTVQGESEGFFMTNAAIRKDFLKNKLSVTLSVRDLFKGGKREMTSSGQYFYSYEKFQREAPVFTLNVSYLINNYKKQRNTDRQDENNGEGEMEF